VSDLPQYIAAILLEKARLYPDEAYGGSAQSIRLQLTKEIGGAVSAEDVEGALAILSPFAAADVDFSPLTGGFWTINYDNFRYYFLETKSEEEDDAAIYAEISEQTGLYPILQAYARRGSRYALDAAQHLKAMSFAQWADLRDQGGTRGTEIPASNRVVTLTHNQQSEIESAASDVINVVEAANSIDGDSSIRQRIVGQIKAARELVRAQTLNVHLLYLTTVGVLNHLIEKYGGQAIGEAAKKLLDLLIESVFKK